MLHAFGAAVPHGLKQIVARGIVHFDARLSARTSFEHFYYGNSPAAVFAGNQTLRNYVAECSCQAAANRRLFGHGKRTDHAVDSFGDTYGIEARKNQVSAFGGF